MATIKMYIYTPQKVHDKENYKRYFQHNKATPVPVLGLDFISFFTPYIFALWFWTENEKLIKEKKYNNYIFIALLEKQTRI